jgi:hypothetical protein
MLEHIHCLNFYGLRKAPGTFGEAATEREGRVQWGAGGDTDVYLYDGKKFVETIHASEER